MSSDAISSSASSVAAESSSLSSDEESSNFRRLFKLARPHAGPLTLATLSLFIGSGIGLLYPQMARFTIDDVIQQGGTAGMDMRTIGLLLLGLFAVQAVFVSIRYYLFTVVGDRIVTDLRNDLYRAIMSQEMGFFDERKTGELTSRLASDTQVLQSAVTVNLSMLLRYGAQAVGAFGLMFITSWKLSLVLLVLLPVVFGVAIVYGRMVRKLSRKVQDAIAASTSIAEETISGVRTVRSFAREGQERGRYMEATEESFNLAKKRAVLGSFFGGGMSFLGYGAMAVVLWVGSTMVMEKTITPGDLTAFILYTLMLSFSLGALSGLYGDLMKAVGASERVFGLLDRQPALPVKEDARVQPPERGEVTFENVRFAYPTRPEIDALGGVSFTLEPGKKLALVGPSGSGKSTVAALLSRFYDPQQGDIAIDHIDLKNWDPDALRESVGMVAQEPILFSGTIRENVLYGKPGASDEEVLAALEAANARGFVEDFPEGVETVIGERGVRLSGGQKQRIAIARAVLKDPAVLILDEATSALDVESEAVVQRALERLMEGRTTLIIAHRLSTIRNADTVVVLDRGQVVEAGTHRELMAHQSLYYRLVESQQLLD
jgi:ATP-binding cassette subfamily B protein